MTRRWIPIAACLVLLVSACAAEGGGTQDEGEPAGTPIVFDGQELPQYVAPEEGLLEDIRERGVLYNGVNAANPPFEFVDESGRIVGYDIDLATEFAEWLGVEIATVDTAWDGVIPSLYTRKFDMIWSAMSITPLRQEAVNFSQPYASDQAVWITLASDESVNQVSDLDGQAVCTQLNSAFEAQAQGIIDDSGYDIELKSFQDFPTAYLALENGECAAGTSSTLNNLPLNEEKPGVFRNAIFFDEANYVGVATRLPDTDLAEQIREFVDEIKGNGRLVELQMEWFGFEMELPDEVPQD